MSETAYGLKGRSLLDMLEYHNRCIRPSENPKTVAVLGALLSHPPGESVDIQTLGEDATGYYNKVLGLQGTVSEGGVRTDLDRLWSEGFINRGRRRFPDTGYMRMYYSLSSGWRKTYDNVLIDGRLPCSNLTI